MCRLFGFRSSTVASVHRSLVMEKNSLQFQSREHPDGWGIASYGPGPAPEVAHGLGPAHSDPEFDRVSSMLSSHTVLAHVRLASVGSIHIKNAHPFIFERWAFAHNGTVQRFDQHKATIEKEIDRDLLAHVQGETDSERCFYFFLTRLRRLAKDPADPSVEDVARALCQVTSFVGARSDTTERPSGLNFLVTDGRLMVASRRHRTLFFSEQRKRAEPSHPPPVDGTKVAQLVIASEELSGEDHWHDIPQDGVLALTPDFILRRWMARELV